MKRTNLAYTAGIIDGEGSIYITTHRTNKVKRGYSLELHVKVGNTNEWLCNWLKFSFGGSVYYMPKQGFSGTPFWTWQIHANQALHFLELILPYLQLKRPQAELAITFQSQRKKSRHKSQEDIVFEEAQRILLAKANKYRTSNEHNT